MASRRRTSGKPTSCVHEQERGAGMALLWQWRIPSDLTTQDATSLRATRLSERLTQVLINNRIFLNRTQQEL